MNAKWLLIMDCNPYVANDDSGIQYFVFISDAEAMSFLEEHNAEWQLLDIKKVQNWKGDLDE